MFFYAVFMLGVIDTPWITSLLLETGSLASQALSPLLLLCYLHIRAVERRNKERRAGLVKIGKFSGSTGMLGLREARD